VQVGPQNYYQSVTKVINFVSKWSALVHVLCDILL